MLCNAKLVVNCSQFFLDLSNFASISFYRWFVHFYILSFIWNGFILMNAVQCTLQGSVLPLWFSKMMSFLTSYPVSPPSGKWMWCHVSYKWLFFNTWPKNWLLIFLMHIYLNGSYQTLVSTFRLIDMLSREGKNTNN